ncbi:DUF547 domain-containing protein [Halovenus sp. HT40]|uniref:DUF547 domain-containing protein n=1 Tax=Halovenus sp. HT40 TaxID=3126691 RepID=UPI00300F72FD
MTDDPLALAEAFLLATRHGDSTEAARDGLAALTEATLSTSLDTNEAKFAFWINVYNAATQDALDTNPAQYENKRTFFSKPLVTVAGKQLSLDDIEHGILRRSYSKYTLGYVRSPFRNEFCDRHAVERRDPRLHFAVNCGADSCPPIAAYTADGIDRQLDVATEGYLDAHVEYDPHDGRASLPRLMLWYRGDFGRKRDLLEFLVAYNQLPPGTRPRLSYQDWDWSMAPKRYTEHLPKE